MSQSSDPRRRLADLLPFGYIKASRGELVSALVEWRQAHGGSRSAENHRKALMTWSVRDLRRRALQIIQQEAGLR